MEVTGLDRHFTLAEDQGQRSLDHHQHLVPAGVVRSRFVAISRLQRPGPQLDLLPRRLARQQPGATLGVLSYPGDFVDARRILAVRMGEADEKNVSTENRYVSFCYRIIREQAT